MLNTQTFVNHKYPLNEIFVWGFNHHMLGIHERSSVSIDEETIQRLYVSARVNQIPSLCILNTCNRTEFYGIGNIEVVQNIFFELQPDAERHKSKAVSLTGHQAIEHLLKVASGLDSQIIGDAEILGQFKSSFKNAKKHNLLNGYMERLSNISMQAAKEIKHSTAISTGTTSFSYATINLLLDSKITEDAKILIIGTGTLGKNIAKNIRSYFPKNTLYLSNRTFQKSQQLSNQLNCECLDFSQIPVEAGNFDIIITSVGNVKSYLITYPDLPEHSPKLMIDLSIPSVIDPNVIFRRNVTFFSLDHVSTRIDRTLTHRKEDIPLAEQIIHKYIHEFRAWSSVYQKSGSIKHWKKLMEASSLQCPHLASLDEEQRSTYLKKSITQFALYIKSNAHALKDEDEREIIKNYLVGLGCEHHHHSSFEDCSTKSTTCPVCPR